MCVILLLFDKIKIFLLGYAWIKSIKIIKKMKQVIALWTILLEVPGDKVGGDWQWRVFKSSIYIIHWWSNSWRY